MFFGHFFTLLHFDEKFVFVIKKTMRKNSADESATNNNIDDGQKSASKPNLDAEDRRKENRGQDVKSNDDPLPIQVPPALRLSDNNMEARAISNLFVDNEEKKLLGQDSKSELNRSNPIPSLERSALTVTAQASDLNFKSRRSNVRFHNESGSSSPSGSREESLYRADLRDEDITAKSSKSSKGSTSSKSTLLIDQSFPSRKSPETMLKEQNVKKQITGSLRNSEGSRGSSSITPASHKSASSLARRFSRVPSKQQMLSRTNYRDLEIGTIQEKAYSKLSQALHFQERSGLGSKSLHRLDRPTLRATKEHKPSIVSSKIGDISVESFRKRVPSISSLAAGSKAGSEINTSNIALDFIKRSQRSWSKATPSSLDGSDSEHTSLILSGNKAGLLKRLAKYVSADDFVVDDDHLSFFEAAKQTTYLETPEPILAAIKEEVLPILTVRLSHFRKVFDKIKPCWLNFIKDRHRLLRFFRFI